MVKAELWLSEQQAAQLKMQLMLASTNHEIRTDRVLHRLVIRAGRRVRQGTPSPAVARQIVVDLGYYLLCHGYEMPRAAYDLLAVAEQIDAHHRTQAKIVQLPRPKA